MKDTKSSGDMLKETNNINRSLFTLGKVPRVEFKSRIVLEIRLAKDACSALALCEARCAVLTLHVAAGRSLRRWQRTRAAAPTSRTATRSSPRYRTGASLFVRSSS